MFPNPYGIARKHRIEIEDLFQYAACGLWKGILSYKSNRGQIKTHLINNIRWHVNERLNRETSMIKYNPNRKCDKYRLISMDVEINDTAKDHNTYHDIVASDVDVELHAISDIKVENILSEFNDKDRKVIELRIKDLSPTQIAKIMNTSPSNIRMKIYKIKSLLGSSYDYNYKSKQGSKNKGRKVYIEGKVYDYIKDASEELNIKQNTICDRLKSKSDRFKEWYYVS
jgi:RNA polymerase sigma factor (sigma-70 family)